MSADDSNNIHYELLKKAVDIGTPEALMAVTNSRNRAIKAIDLLDKNEITVEQASIMMARDIELLEADIAKAQGKTDEQII